MVYLPTFLIFNHKDQPNVVRYTIHGSYRIFVKHVSSSETRLETQIFESMYLTCRSMLHRCLISTSTPGICFFDRRKMIQCFGFTPPNTNGWIPKMTSYVERRYNFETIIFDIYVRFR